MTSGGFCPTHRLDGPCLCPANDVRAEMHSDALVARPATEEKR